MLQILLLSCGVIAAALYIVADIATAAQYPGYSYINQVISELSAVGAPTSDLWGRFMVPWGVLMLAFAIGMVRAAKEHPLLRTATNWILVLVISGPVWGFLPMHMRGAPFDWRDAGHIAMGAITVLLMLAIVWTASNAFGKKWGLYSLVMLAVLFVAAVPTFAYVPRMIAGQPTPLIGIFERIDVYGFFIWTGLLAGRVIALRTRAPEARYEIPHSAIPSR